MKTHVVALAVAALGAIASFPAFAGVTPLGYQVYAGSDKGGVSGPLPPGTYTNSLIAYDAFAGSTAPSVNGFESLASGVSQASIVFTGPNGEVSATLSGGNGKVQVNQPAGQAFNGRYSVGPDAEQPGTKFWEVEANEEETTFELSFSRKVEAFGFFGVDIGDFNGSLFLDFLGATGDVLFTVDTQAELGGALPGGGSVLYLGVKATEASLYFEGVRFRTGASILAQSLQSSGNADDPGQSLSDLFGFDSFSVVAAPGTQPPNGVPAPGTALLLGSALAGLALMRRRA